jgi:hypothetical protein
MAMLSEANIDYAPPYLDPVNREYYSWMRPNNLLITAATRLISLFCEKKPKK